MIKIDNIITESEKNRILDLYKSSPINDYVIVEWLSPDEKYVIFLDELYDIENKTKLGDIWENIDNFKFFIKHSFEVAKDVPKEIMESVQTSLDSLILTESNNNYSSLKPYIKQYMMNEGLRDWVMGAGKWLKDTAVSAVQGVGDFLSTSYEGIKGVVKGITTGDWSQVLNLLKKGALWVARKIRSALYHPIGIIFDAILVATGIGKAAQFVIWSVVVALDIYELLSGNYEDKEESFIVRLLFTGVDILGLVFAGVAAKTAKGVIGGVIKKFGTSIEGLSRGTKSNPVFRNTLEKMMSGAQSASSKMNSAGSYLQKNSPMLYKFVSSIMGGLSRFTQKIVDTIGQILGVGKKIVTAPGKAIEKGLGTGKLGKGTRAGVETTGLVGGIGTYQSTKNLGKEKEFEDIFRNAKPDFDGV